MRVHRALAACIVMLGGVAAADPSTDQARTVTETYFAFDSAQLDGAAAQKLARAIEQLRTAPDARIVVRGFADSTGASDYNLQLSIRRAEAVRDVLARSGVSPDRMVFSYYGEDGPRRASHALDRRVSVQLTGEPLHAIVNRELPEATALLWPRPVTAAELTGRPIPVATR